MIEMKTDAILWDYDGTLVNSVPKNIETTIEILNEVAPRLTGENLPDCLKSEEAYHLANHQSRNWQDLYLNYYGMTTEELNAAAPLWTSFQLKNRTPVQLFPGIKEFAEKTDVPMGICSQNSSANIKTLLEQNQILSCFSSIIGYDDIPENAQKPNPYGGIKCLEELKVNKTGSTIIYVGDHEGDVEFARNIERESREKIKIIAITVLYSGSNPEKWRSKPDFAVNSLQELEKILKR